VAYSIPNNARIAKRIFEFENDGVKLVKYGVYSDDKTTLDIYAVRRADVARPETRVVKVVDEKGWQQFRAAVKGKFTIDDSGAVDADPVAWTSLKQSLSEEPREMVFMCPRGVGPTRFDASERKQIQNRRRFYLLGETLDGMQAVDVLCAVYSLGAMDKWGPGAKTVPVTVEGRGPMAGVALYASLKLQDVIRLELYDLPKSHREGPIFLNVERFLDMPQAVAMAAERSQVVIYQDDDSGWEYPQAVAKALGWDEKQIQIRRKPTAEGK
jgi:hypothetical protein